MLRNPISFVARPPRHAVALMNMYLFTEGFREKRRGSFTLTKRRGPPFLFFFELHLEVAAYLLPTFPDMDGGTVGGGEANDNLFWRILGALQRRPGDSLEASEFLSRNHDEFFVPRLCSFDSSVETRSTMTISLITPTLVARLGPGVATATLSSATAVIGGPSSGSRPEPPL